MWGWEPTVSYFYEDGRLAASVAEPEFDENQLVLVRALYEHEASLNSLGIPLDEATSPDADKDNRHGRYYYEVDDLIDHSLAAESRWRASLPDDEFRDARVARVRRVERRESPKRR